MNRTAAVALVLALATTGAVAETAWISDRLQAGLHEEPNAASTVLLLLSSGTAVDVLERDGALARVRLANGDEGWIDAMYLSDEKPAALLLAEVDAARADAMRELDAANERIAELQNELQAAQEAAATPATAGSNVQPATFEAPVNSETLREMQRLAEENQRVKQQLAEAEAAAAMAIERIESQQVAEETTPAAPVAPVDTSPHFLFALLHWNHWQWITLGGTLLLAFAFGLWVADAGVRRRHGGFRLRV